MSDVAGNDQTQAAATSKPLSRAKLPEATPQGPERPAEGQEEREAPKKAPGLRARLAKHWLALSIAGLLLAGGIIYGVRWYQNSLSFVTSDDAFVDGRPVFVSFEVMGTIVAVPVTDNQIVKAGDLLAQIDDRNYRAAVDLAAAQVEQAEANVVSISAQLNEQQAQIAQTKTQVVQAQAAFEFSKQQNARYQDLAQKGAGTVQRAEQATSDLTGAGATFTAAQAAQTVAERQLSVLTAQEKGMRATVAQARAQKATADANLSRTVLRATSDGRVTKLTAAVGQLATQAQGVMILVPLDTWVTANFKETQLASVRVGQPVSIEVDAFGRSFPGHVNSVQSGSGTVFSLLPAQNATGNYVKVVQRIPVKITFDQRPDVQLGPGMSVIPTVDIR